MKEIYLGLGTNLGEREQNLEKTIKAIEEQVGKVLKRSSVYETEPWGKTDQPNFLNMVIEVDTELPPLDLLKQCNAIEKELGRVRMEKWGPRLIDIDILLYGDETIDLPELQVPHPYMHERDFVMLPLKEINPAF